MLEMYATWGWLFTAFYFLTLVFTEEFVGPADDAATKVKDDLDRDILENGNLFRLNVV